MTAIFVDQVADHLRANIRGEVVTPETPEYDEARKVWNGVIDRRPAIIVRCSDTSDVVATVNAARDNELLVSIRGGGHNVAGLAVNDGGIVIDLSNLRGVTVDLVAKTARVQGGATWADVDQATQQFGMAIPGGKVSSTGVAGFTLHGGMSWLVRKYGLALDNLLSVEIVTADGVIHTASQKHNADLFWAVRGAGSNFGVVTSFEFQCHPFGPDVAFVAPFYAIDDWPKVLRAFRKFAQTAPDEISSQALFCSIPSHPMFPPEIHGTQVLIIAGCHSGEAVEGEQAMRVLQEFATPILNLSGRMPYTALQTAFDPFFPTGGHYYFKSMYFDELSDATLEELSALAATRPAPESMIILWQIGGAMRRTRSRTPHSATETRSSCSVSTQSGPTPGIPTDASPGVEKAGRVCAS